MLPPDVLRDCLDMTCAVFGRQLTQTLEDVYYQSLSDLNAQAIVDAFKIAIDETKFPSPGRIRELVIGETKFSDWLKILAVANGSEKATTISGLAAQAAIECTSSHGIRAALGKIGTCTEFQLAVYRKDWESLIRTPRQSTKALPAAAVEISLEPPLRDREEIDRDWDFSARKSSIKTLLSQQKMSPGMARELTKQWPRDHRQEILDLIPDPANLPPLTPLEQSLAASLQV